MQGKAISLSIEDIKEENHFDLCPSQSSVNELLGLVNSFTKTEKNENNSNQLMELLSEIQEQYIVLNWPAQLFIKSSN
jgi:hypothetical protein